MTPRHSTLKSLARFALDKLRGRTRSPLRTSRARLLVIDRLEDRSLLSVNTGSFYLTQDTGYSGTDNVTSNASITGVAYAGSGDVEVQFDHNGDGQADGAVTHLGSGVQFNYDPRMVDSAFAADMGEKTVYFRAIELDTEGEPVTTTEWQSFQFILTPTSQAAYVAVDSVVVDRGAGVAAVEIHLATPSDQLTTLAWRPREGTAVRGENWSNGTWHEGYTQGATWVEGHYQNTEWVEAQGENQVWVDGYYTNPEWGDG